MCGICGIISTNENASSYSNIIKNINSALSHRGPDGEGSYSDEHVILAMRRLSIIDLEGGWQPLYNEDGTLVLIANGEIYNYIELQMDLAERGHHFSTKSDCETILHLYEEYGYNCVHHLRGIFAFALWDTKNHRLVLARDRMGEKPLYFFEQEHGLVFASELKALMVSGIVPFELDPNAINLFFYYQYVPEPRTPLKNVSKLPAGHILTVDINPCRFHQTCYWRMGEAPALTGNPTELIRAELERISELIIRSDVPVGLALSGGLDSSAIAALVTRKYPEAMHAFSIGYPGYPPSDERRDAEKFADYLGMPFHDIELKTEDLVTKFPELILAQDDPIADISGFGYYSVMKLARDNNIPVMLQGQGGDELFFGYSWVRDAVNTSLRKQKLLNRGNVCWTDYFEWKTPQLTSLSEVFRWVRTMGGITTAWNCYRHDTIYPEDQLIFIDTLPDFQTADKSIERLYDPSFLRQISRNEVFSFFTKPQPWKHIDVILTELISQTYLLENGIVQGDRLSMASSVELRLPLVDYRLVETVIGLRKTYPDYQLPPKAWFMDALKDIVPDWVMYRPKRGFAPPVKEWHNAIFREYGELLDGGYLVRSHVLNEKSAAGLAKGPRSQMTITPLSFKALVLELWCREISQITQQGNTHG